MEKAQTGILYGIGTGPGDPEMMTLKAVRLLGACDQLAVPADNREDSLAYRTAVQAVPSIEKLPCICIEMPMTRDAAILKRKHREGAEALMALLDAGHTVAFLTLGDPCLYSTFTYAADILSDEGYPVEYINGVPSFLAAAAAAGITLANREQQVHILPSEEDNERAKGLAGTKVYMKPRNRAKQLLSSLRDADTSEVYMIENCGYPEERVYRGRDALPKETGYLTVMIEKERAYG